MFKGLDSLFVNCKLQIANCLLFTIYYLLFILSSIAIASFDDLEGGTRPLGMGGAFSAVGNDANAIYWNPACLRLTPSTEIITRYFKLFGLSELQDGSISIVQPTTIGSFGIGYRTFGKSSYYKEDSGILAYSFAVHSKILLGLSANYMMLSIKDYGSDNAIGLNAGILWRAMRGIQLGVYMNNINSPTISKENENLPKIISGGISFIPVRGLTLAGDLYKDFDHDLQIRVGQELRIIKYLAIRGGVQTKPSRFTAGVGFYVMNLALDYAFYSHSTLGGSHNVSLTIRLGEREGDHIFDYESAMKPHTKKGKKKSQDLKPGEKIDINTATIEDFMRVPGIGPSTAKAIVEYREKVGGFKDVKEIMKVKRIGPKTFEKIKDYLMIAPQQ